MRAQSVEFEPARQLISAPRHQCNGAVALPLNWPFNCRLLAPTFRLFVCSLARCYHKTSADSSSSLRLAFHLENCSPNKNGPTTASDDCKVANSTFGPSIGAPGNHQSVERARDISHTQAHLAGAFLLVFFAHRRAYIARGPHEAEKKLRRNAPN